MTRTTLYKGVYFGIMAGALVLAGLAYALSGYQAWAPLVVLLVLLIPGRVLAYFWRDLLTGLRLLNARQFLQSKVASERFVVYVRKEPWIKHLIWLGTSSYSRDPEVLALNNLGAAEHGLGEDDAARRHLNEAVALDPLCPLPFLNLGVIAAHKGEMAEAERCFAESRRLGLHNDLSDRIVRASQARYAEREG